MASYTGKPLRNRPDDPKNGKRISRAEHEFRSKLGKQNAQFSIQARRAKMAELNSNVPVVRSPVEDKPQVVDVKRTKSFWKCIQEELDKLEPNSILTRREKAAMAFVDEMEAGSFAHGKEVLDREEGKVPSRLSIEDGIPLKAFINMPTEGEEAP